MYLVLLASFALLLIELTRSTTLDWVFEKTIKKTYRNLSKQSFSSSSSYLVVGVVNRYLTLTLHRSFTSKYLTLALFLLSRYKRTRHFAKRYRNNIDIKLVFSSFEIGNVFGVKDSISCGFRTCMVYKFLCAGCYTC